MRIIPSGWMIGGVVYWSLADEIFEHDILDAFAKDLLFSVKISEQNERCASGKVQARPWYGLLISSIRVRSGKGTMKRRPLTFTPRCESVMDSA